MISSWTRAANVWMELFAAAILGLFGRFDRRFALAAHAIFEKTRFYSRITLLTLNLYVSLCEKRKMKIFLLWRRRRKTTGKHRLLCSLQLLLRHLCLGQTFAQATARTNLIRQRSDLQEAQRT